MAVLVSDSFNRTANASSLGTTDSYNGGTAKTWTVIGTGVYGIDTSGYAYITTQAPSGHGCAYVDAGVSDASVSINVRNTDTSEFPKLVYRVLDAENYSYVEYNLASAASATLILKKYISGTGNTISTSATFTPTVNDVIKVTANGQSITVFLNGTSMITTTDSFNQTSTKWGFMSYKYPNTRFDNFIVESLGSPSSNIKVYNGSSFVDVPLSSIKRWNDSAWVTATGVKRWDGSTWQTVL